MKNGLNQVLAVEDVLDSAQQPWVEVLLELDVESGCHSVGTPNSKVQGRPEGSGAAREAGRPLQPV